MLELVPITLREANDFVAAFHRHNGRTSRNGGKFAIGVTTGEQLVGVAIVGNPLCSHFMDGYTAEVLRTCVSPDAPPNVNSMLYGACWRAWKAMGGRKLITYTLATETGVSLRAAGWTLVYESKPHRGWSNTGRERQWQPIYGQLKYRWEMAA